MMSKRASGVLLHPTSLPGPHGMGDLGPEAHHFVEWLHACGQTWWQWLPTTPVGPDASPYQGVSALAGNPLWVALEPLVERGWLDAAALTPAWETRRVDHARVAPWRMAQLRRAHTGFQAARGRSASEAFLAWCAHERGWLDNYALFMALEQRHEGQPWWCWPEALAMRRPDGLAAATRALGDELDFWRFVQWCFDEQCAALRRHAADRGVRILGDMPLFVAHHSADCWARPDLFRLGDDLQPTEVAGAPPDAMGPLGQRWGNPLYRWDRMAREGYAWWVARMRRALHLADAVRMDHFRGLAAGWEIPVSSADAREGRWVPGPGRALFDAMQRALGPLPIVAEDLGHITPDVHALREACGFPGMKILQFAFDGDARSEHLPHNYTRHCVAYTGTHDNDTVQGWWAQSGVAQRHFAGSYLACDARDVHWCAIRAVMNSVADLAIVPLQDLLGLGTEHRMNTPGTVGPHNWSWRFSWDQVGTEPGRVLGLLTAASGRARFDLLGGPLR